MVIAVIFMASMPQTTAFWTVIFRVSQQKQGQNAMKKGHDYTAPIAAEAPETTETVTVVGTIPAGTVIDVG